MFTLTHYYNHQNPLISNLSHNIIFPNNRMDYILIGHAISRMNKLRHNMLYESLRVTSSVLTKYNCAR